MTRLSYIHSAAYFAPEKSLFVDNRPALLRPRGRVSRFCFRSPLLTNAGHSYNASEIPVLAGGEKALENAVGSVRINVSATPSATHVPRRHVSSLRADPPRVRHARKRTLWTQRPGPPRRGESRQRALQPPLSSANRRRPRRSRTPPLAPPRASDPRRDTRPPPPPRQRPPPPCQTRTTRRRRNRRTPCPACRPRAAPMCQGRRRSRTARTTPMTRYAGDRCVPCAASAPASSRVWLSGERFFRWLGVDASEV